MLQRAVIFLVMAIALTGLLAHGALAGPGIDVEQATQAYLASVSPEEIANTNAYVDTGYRILLMVTVLDLLLAYVFLRFGWSRRWRELAERVFRRKFLQAYVYVPIWFAVSTLLSFPLVVYADFVVEHRHGLSTQGFAAWFVEQLQNMAIDLIAISLFLSLFYLVVRLSPRKWWLWGAGLVTSFLALIMFVAPIFILPIFNDYRPMDEGPLKEQILSIARANGMQADEVQQVDESKQTTRVSANVAGLFGTARIALNDNLLRRASPDGVEAVMAHEIGHYVLNHVWKTLISYTLVFLFGFALTSALFTAIQRRRGATWGIRGVDDYAGFPLLYALASVFVLLTTPVFNTITRVQETEADLFAINATQKPDAWAEIALLTADYRKLAPPAWEERWLNHHPSPYARVRMAMVWKAAQRDQGQAPARAAAPVGAGAVSGP